MRKKVILSWSGGKDSALAYYYIQKAEAYEIVALFTTVTEVYDRVSMHGVRRELLEKQAESLRAPLHTVYIPRDCTDREYESRMEEALATLRSENPPAFMFGDIFLEDIRRYRERNLAKRGMEAMFPLWKQDTEELVTRFIELGFKAIVTCVDSRVLDSSFVGKHIDQDFMERLPLGVDPSGEHGEFHSFVYDGPIFQQKISVSIGEVVLRDSFFFCDLLPG
jgi:uncharacterized protein (TIGR00290 family)